MSWTTTKGSTIRRITKPCITCSNPFDSFISQKRKYCSVACRCSDVDYKKKMSEVSKAKEPRYGSDNPNWRGGTTEARHLAMSRNIYKEWRKAVYRRDNHTCVECGAVGTGRNLNADHIKPYSTHPELRYELSNGRTLCIDCHKATDTYGWKMFNMRKVTA